ncbi:ATP-binding cassette domain-containing protein [Natronincola ferrireducens]|uniref:Carbohydrate ABC transporter ATP-binding protein, CUT1 family n=1 Tax=Natronincola ferrireducens TaxID=393762 RepID=A0A1G8ZWG6_9FIRM|nr:ATP-binding cassette domain-containing protein [Natronincola ferrireducens]SDK19472.1 carbohydrate ABC transporter ATP-binding protein, CUT1 family [Natronincola ferrireducens]
MNVTISALTKYYENKCILNIDDFTIDSGALLGIIGPNGAGKSTLVKILAGLDTPSSGEIKYNDEAFSADILRNMTMVFQKPYLLRTSVFNNIAYPLKIRGVHPKEIAHRVEALIQEMGLKAIAHQNAWTLSGGEAQKVALARAIIFRPSLLILDEPTANIDPASILMMEKTIKNFYAQCSPTIIIVTHNIQQAKRICKEVAFMHYGQVLERDETKALIYHPTNPTVQGFIEGELIL